MNANIGLNSLWLLDITPSLHWVRLILSKTMQNCEGFQIIFVNWCKEMALFMALLFICLNLNWFFWRIENKISSPFRNSIKEFFPGNDTVNIFSFRLKVHFFIKMFAHRQLCAAFISIMISELISQVASGKILFETLFLPNSSTVISMLFRKRYRKIENLFQLCVGLFRCKW